MGSELNYTSLLLKSIEPLIPSNIIAVHHCIAFSIYAGFLYSVSSVKRVLASTARNK